jgi:hypothetical protein
MATAFVATIVANVETERIMIDTTALKAYLDNID